MPVSFISPCHLLQSIFNDDQDLIVEDVDFCYTHLALIIREGLSFRLCSVPLPLPSGKVRNQGLGLTVAMCVFMLSSFVILTLSSIVIDCRKDLI